MMRTQAIALTRKVLSPAAVLLLASLPARAQSTPDATPQPPTAEQTAQQTAPASSTAAPQEAQPAAQTAADPATAAAEHQIYTPNQLPGSQALEKTPVDALIVRVPPATTLNSDAGSIEYADRHSQALTLQVEGIGIYTSNLFNDFSSASSVKPGPYMEFTIPVGYQHITAESSYNVYFRGSIANYPGNSTLNHTAQIFSAEYVHNTSERTTWDFSAAGGRVQTVEGYLPAVVTVGSTGVVQANFSSSLRPLYNAASTFSMTHRLSAVNTIIVSATGGFMQQPFSQATSTAPATLYRNQTAGLDLQWQHAINARQALGLELTNVYINGMSPVGHSNFVSLQGTYHQALQRHWALVATAGPLYSQAQAPSATPLTSPATAKVYSYNASGALDYQTSFAHISGGYRRVLQLGYLAAASPASQYFLLFDRPITHTLNFTVDSRYGSSASSGPGAGSYSSFGLSTRLTEQLANKLVVFLGGQFFNQTQGSSTIGRNEATLGFTYTFGNVLAREGIR